MSNYTNITKPTGASYTKLSPSGNEFFDDSNVTFDSAVVFFNGINSTSWTKITNPKQSIFLTPGMTMGLAIPLTESRDTRLKDPWTRINKPT